MNDKETMELAARAAGISVVWDETWKYFVGRQANQKE